MRLAVCVLLAAAAGCANTPPEADPTQIRLNDLDSRLTRMEHVVTNQSSVDVANQLESMRADIRAMHNDVDILSHHVEALRKQQHDLYADVDLRIKALENRATAPSVGAVTGVGAIGDGSDHASYQAAFDLLKDGKYDSAISAFQEFLNAYPASELADNAQYWLGEAYYVSRSYSEALAAFQRVLAKFPKSRKVPDALLKIGYCDYELKEFSQARDALTQVTTQFPDAPSAHLAQQRLDKMAAEPH